MLLKDTVRDLLEEALKEQESLFLIDYNLYAGNRIEIIIDGDEGVTVDDCIAISRAIEHNLDREEEDFSLEVMSAGVSEELKQVRQYKKNIGRTLRVKTKEITINAELVSVTDSNITLVWKAREPKPVGKGKITVTKEACISYDEIEEAKVMITF